MAGVAAHWHRTADAPGPTGRVRWWVNVEFGFQWELDGRVVRELERGLRKGQ